MISHGEEPSTLTVIGGNDFFYWTCSCSHDNDGILVQSSLLYNITESAHILKFIEFFFKWNNWFCFTVIVKQQQKNKKTVLQVTQSWSQIQQNLSFNTDPNIDCEFIYDKTFLKPHSPKCAYIFKTTVGVGLVVL